MWFIVDVPNGIGWVYSDYDSVCMCRINIWFCSPIQNLVSKLTGFVGADEANYSDILVVLSSVFVLRIKWIHSSPIWQSWHLHYVELVYISYGHSAHFSNCSNWYPKTSCASRIRKYFMHTRNVQKSNLSIGFMHLTIYSVSVFFFILQVANGGFSYFMLLRQVWEFHQSIHKSYICGKKILTSRTLIISTWNMESYFFSK